MSWVSSEGGPLILIGKSDLSNWEGIDGFDYDRACPVEDYVGVIEVGNSQDIG